MNYERLHECGSGVQNLPAWQSGIHKCILFTNGPSIPFSFKHQLKESISQLAKPGKFTVCKQRDLNKNARIQKKRESITGHKINFLQRNTNHSHVGATCLTLFSENK